MNLIRLALFWGLFLWVQGTAQSWTSYRIMNYNLLGYPASFSSVDYRYNDLASIISYVQPDIMGVNELRDDGDDRYADTLLSRSFNTNGITHYTHADMINPSPAGDLNNMLFYNTDKFFMLSHQQIYCPVRDFDHYKLLILDPTLPCHLDSIILDIIVCHLKAGTADTDDNARAQQAQIIADYIHQLPADHNVHLIGDFNLYDEANPAYTILVSAAATHTMVDTEGPWDRSVASEVLKYTQSTRTMAYPGTNGGATSGLDDRFDFHFMDQNLVNNLQNVQFITGSYKALGNDGLHYDLALIDSPPNAVIPPSLAQDLFDMSDHLPIIKDYAVTWPNPLPVFSNFGPYCTGDLTAALPATSNNNINGSWSPSSISTTNAGTTSYTFTPSGGSCSNTTTILVVVNPSTTPTFNSFGPYCVGATAAALPTTSTNNITGSWSPSSISTATAGTTTYTFTPASGQCATSTTIAVIVNANVVPSFNSFGPYCVGATAAALPTTSTNNITGSWSPSSISTATAGTTTYTFTPASGQCATTTTISVTITSPGCNEVYGCMDASACNYDPNATIEDSSCDYSCYGCTDALAHNYDPAATVEDGSCQTCNDELQNGDENGIDCGGSCYDACSFMVMAQVLLEGIYNPSTGLMSTALLTNNIIPLSQPYSAAPYYYLVNESVTTIPANVVNWILVEIRDANDPTIVVSRRAGFLSYDGEILDLDGSVGLSFTGLSYNAPYKIAVYHRSHLGVLSSGILVGAEIMSHDFTNSVLSAEGPSQMKLVGTRYTLYAGDYNGNGVINNIDYNLWYSDNAAVNAYYSWDGDGNAVVNSLDYNYWYANRSKVGLPAIQY